MNHNHAQDKEIIFCEACVDGWEEWYPDFTEGEAAYRKCRVCGGRGWYEIDDD